MSGETSGFSLAIVCPPRPVGRRTDATNFHQLKSRSLTERTRKEEPRYSRRVSMDDIAGNDFNLNISRYISTAVAEEEIDLGAVNAKLVSLQQKIAAATKKHNTFLKELGLSPLP